MTPPAAPRRPLRAVAWALVALVGIAPEAISLSAAMAQSRGPSASGTPSGIAGFDPRGLPGLAETPGTGGLVPDLQGVTLDGSRGLSTSLSPRLVAKGLTGEITYEVRDLAGKLAWSARANGPVNVSRGQLRQGSSYAWSAAGGGKSVGPYLFQVDMQRPAVQPVTGFGGLSVAETTGEPVVSLRTTPVQSVGGQVAVTMTYQPSNSMSATPTPGLPAGWRFGDGSAWTSMRFIDANAVELSDGAGQVVLYGRDPASNLWRPRLGLGRSAPASQSSVLAPDAAGTSLSVTDPSGTVTVFRRPDTRHRVTRPTAVWSSKEPVVSRQYDASGRLTSITDPVSGRRVVLTYAVPGVECPLPPLSAAGLTPAPSGFLCSIAAWDGSRTDLLYSGAATAPRIGRVIADAQAPGPQLSQTDIGWDSVGRPTRLRSATTNAALASGVLSGFGAGNADDGALLSEYAYDATGRVTGITRPAALQAGDANVPARDSRTFAYGPPGTTKVLASGVATPYSVTEADAATMLVRKEVDPAGRVTTVKWDTATDMALERHTPGGFVTRYQYDPLGRMLNETGPSTASTTAGAPTVTYAYDRAPTCATGPARVKGATARATRAQRCTRTSRRSVPARVVGGRAEMVTTTGGLTGPRTKALDGLQATFWAGRGFAGVPVAHQTGPAPNGHVPAVLSTSWASAMSPAGAGAPFSARLTGFLTAPADGTYSITTRTGAALWVGNTACTPTCTLALRATDPTPMRIDLASSAQGSASLTVTWTGPSVNGPVAMSALRPGYPAPSVVATRDQVSTTGGVRTLESVNKIDPSDPQRVLESIGPSGDSVARSYEPYSPSSGGFGRAVGGQTAGSWHTSTTYYGSTETASAGCAGADGAVQGGLASGVSVAAPGSSAAALATRQWYDAAGRVVGQQTRGQVVRCNAYDQAGNLVASTAPGTDSAGEVRTAVTGSVDDNPLASRVDFTESAPGDPDTVVQRFWSSQATDLLGRAVRTRDVWGTITTASYDGLDHVVEATSTTAAGDRTTSTSTIAPDGRVLSVAVDGHQLATVSYLADGRLQGVTYGNGSSVAVQYTANGLLSQRVIRAGGAEMRESVTSSPAGRTLGRRVTGPGADATWTYGYDLQSRLTSATLAGTLPDGVRAGGYRYVLNTAGQRQRVETPDAPGGVTISYDPATGAVTGTTDPRMPGQFTYDTQGRATAVGPLALEYAASGQVRAISDGTTRIEYVIAGDTVVGSTVRGPDGTSSARYSGPLMLDQSDHLVAQSVALPGGVTVRLPATGRDEWQYQDGSGSVAWRAQGEDAPTETVLYDPDGNRLGGQAPAADATRPMLGWKAESGVATTPLSVPTVQMGLRTYVPVLGAFLQPDPVPGTATTPYVYAGSDPINASDPTGALPEWASVFVRAAVATVVAGIIIKVTAGTGTTIAVAAGKAILSGFLSGAVGDAAGQGAVALTDYYLGNETTPFSIGEALMAGAAGAGAAGGEAAWTAFKAGLPLWRAAATPAVTRSVSSASLNSGLGGSIKQTVRSRSSSVYTADMLPDEAFTNPQLLDDLIKPGMNKAIKAGYQKGQQDALLATGPLVSPSASPRPFTQAYKASSGISVWGELND